MKEIKIGIPQWTLLILSSTIIFRIIFDSINNPEGINAIIIGSFYLFFHITFFGDMLE